MEADHRGVTVFAAPEDRGSLPAFARKLRPRPRALSARAAAICARLQRILGQVISLTALSATALDMSAAASPTATFAPWTGGEAPAFILDLLDGGRTRLASYRGDIVLVHFFATWCDSCRAELSALDRLATRRARQGLTVLAISVGEVEPAVRRFFGAHSSVFQVLLDRDRAVAKGWDIYALPTTVMLDETLAPQHVAVGDVDWDDRSIDRLLDRYSPERLPHLSRSRLLRPSAAQFGSTP